MPRQQITKAQGAPSRGAYSQGLRAGDFIALFDGYNRVYGVYFRDPSRREPRWAASCLASLSRSLPSRTWGTDSVRHSVFTTSRGV